MTKQEAIDELNNIKKYNYTLMPTEALDMAIEALSAQPEDVIHITGRRKFVPKFDFNEDEPEQQWIPCSEGLPEELEEVNVTWVNHRPEPYYDFVKDKPSTASAVYYKGDWYWYSSVCTDLLAEYGENEIDKIDDAIEITAWMPLPPSYKGDEDERN